MPTRATALMAQEAITMGRRELFSKRSEIIPESGGATRYPTGSSTVNRMVD